MGAATEKFNFQIKVKGAAMSFKASDIENLAISSILSQIPEGKEFYQESLKIDYQPGPFNSESGKMSLSLLLSAKIYSEINLDSFKKAMAGKSLNEAKILLENQPEVRQFKIRVFPFWIRNIPGSLEKIKIEIKID
jgi:hypothetical protein